MENQEKAENSLEGAIKGPSLPLFFISGRPREGVGPVQGHTAGLAPGRIPGLSAPISLLCAYSQVIVQLITPTDILGD